MPNVYCSHIMKYFMLNIDAAKSYDIYWMGTNLGRHTSTSLELNAPHHRDAEIRTIDAAKVHDPLNEYKLGKAYQYYSTSQGLMEVFFYRIDKNFCVLRAKCTPSQTRRNKYHRCTQIVSWYAMHIFPHKKVLMTMMTRGRNDMWLHGCIQNILTDKRKDTQYMCQIIQ